MTDPDWRWSQIKVGFDPGTNYLDTEDCCLFYMDRVRGGYEKSKANQLITNLKKKPSIRSTNPNEWYWKERAIQRFAANATDILKQLFTEFEGIALVPVFSSKPKNSPEYDNRLVEVANAIARELADSVVYDIFDVDAEQQPAHLGGNRNPETLKKSLICNFPVDINPNFFIIIDDVITTGAHYVVCRDAIREHFPDSKIIGLFWSKQVPNDYSYYFFDLSAE